MKHQAMNGLNTVLLTSFIASSTFIYSSSVYAFADEPPQNDESHAAAAVAAASTPAVPVPEAIASAGITSAPAARKASPYRPVSVPNSAREYYQAVWGVDRMLVRRTASGNLIRFSYRVTDAARATVVNDNHATPYMYGQRSSALLHVPVMDKVGELRQSGVPEATKNYWMVFSNKGDLVKTGDRVNVIIGSFRADGLIVE